MSIQVAASLEIQEERATAVESTGMVDGECMPSRARGASCSVWETGALRRSMLHLRNDCGAWIPG